MSGTEPNLDTKALRNALGQFATGVTVITACEADGTPRGFTANSFTSVSLDPPLILVCIAHAAASCKVFVDASHFTVNILSENQQDSSGLFATQRADKFESILWATGLNGAPKLDNSLAWFECSHHQAIDAGDHIILIGQITAFDHNDAPPLGYFRGSYFSLGLDKSLVDAIERQATLIIGAVFKKDESLLLAVDAGTGEVSLPCVGKNNSDASVELFNQRYSTSPLFGALEFIYSVFEDRRSNLVTLYYRGHATGDAPAGTQFFAFDDIPWRHVKDNATYTLLKRFVHETRTDRFAIYVGDETEGDVRLIE